MCTTTTDGIDGHERDDSRRKSVHFGSDDGGGSDREARRRAKEERIFAHPNREAVKDSVSRRVGTVRGRFEDVKDRISGTISGGEPSHSRSASEGPSRRRRHGSDGTHSDDDDVERRERRRRRRRQDRDGRRRRDSESPSILSDETVDLPDRFDGNGKELQRGAGGNPLRQYADQAIDAFLPGGTKSTSGRMIKGIIGQFLDGQDNKGRK